MEDVQAAFSVAVTKEAMDFQATMSAGMINGTFEKMSEVKNNLARTAGLAAQGIGTKLDIVV